MSVFAPPEKRLFMISKFTRREPPGPGFVVSDRIYDDAFSEDHLWRTMRKLHNAVNMVITILNETTGQVSAKPQTTADTGPSYYT